MVYCTRKDVVFVLGDTIREYRKANNMSQDELAEKLDVTRQSISLWETGQTQPTLENIVALSGLFHVSIDTLLKTESGISNSNETAPEVKENKPKTKKALLISIFSGAAAVLIVALVLILSGIKPSAKKPEQTSTQNTTIVTVTTEDKSAVSTAAVTTTTAPPQTTPVRKVTTTTAKSNAPQTTAAQKATASTAQNNAPQTTAAPQTTTAAKPNKPTDLYGYFKNFVVQNGKLRGDYCVYSKPADNYGGYADEDFSLYYWGDTDTVEFSLHSVLNDTFSINFYLRIPKSNSGAYEYISSHYYRDSGEAVHEAKGVINAAEFTNNYPLRCSSYIGSSADQTDFMENSRIGICDLLGCLDQFLKAENTNLTLKDLGFTNF